jgi:hypothetical protein
MSKIKEKMSREDLGKHVAEIVAKALPEGFIAECVESAIEKNITNFKVEDYVVQGVIKEAILAKAKELLATQFLKQIEERALDVATRAMNNQR